MKTESLINIFKILEPALEKGLEVSVGKEAVDVNTGMKSHCHLKEEDGVIKAFCRYDVVETVESWEDLLSVVADCECRKGFGSRYWFELLEEAGYNVS